MSFLRRLWMSGWSRKMKFFATATRSYNDVPFEDIPEVSPSLIKKTFKNYGMTFEEGHTNYVITCPLCIQNPKKPHKVYVNKTTGMFMCMACKENGQWSNLETYFSRKKIKCSIDKCMSNIEKQSEILKNVIQSTINLKDISNEKVGQILTKFQLPHISLASISKLDIRINEKEDRLFFPLENAESEIVGYKIISCVDSKITILPSSTLGGLLTVRPTKGRDMAVLVPNISDFLILMDAKITYTIVCLPNGVDNLSQNVLPSLERFKKLILWFGHDIKSWDSARHFAKKLGEKRCYFIRSSDKQPLPHLDTNQDFKSVISTACTIWHKSITTFASLRDDVLSELQNIDKVQGVKWKRFPALTKILKGHRRGELTIITGPTGSGKTTFVSEYSLDLAMQGVNTLWGSFEIRNQRLARTMLQQMAGISLDENLNLFPSLADTFEKLPIYFLTFHGQQQIKIVMEAVEHATYVYDIAHVIIDNVQFMMGISEEQRHIDRFWKQDIIIDYFRTFATRRNCHVTLVIHPRKERDDEELTTSSIFGGAKASQEADNVLIIQDKRLTSVRGKKYLQVAKNRYSGDLGIMVLDFDKPSLSYGLRKPKSKSQQAHSKTSDGCEDLDKKDMADKSL